MKTFIRYLLLATTITCVRSIIACPSGTDITPVNEKKEPTLTSKIADLNLQTFPIDEQSHIDTNNYADWLKYAFQKRMEPSPKTRRNNAFKLHIAVERDAKKPAPTDTAMWSDLTLFVGQKDKQRFVAQTIDRTQTEIGRVALYRLLVEPTDDSVRLTKRQKVIAFLLHNPTIYQLIRKALSDLATTEHIILGFWDQDFSFKFEAKNGKCGIDLLDEQWLFLEGKQLYDRLLQSWFLITHAAECATLLGYGLSQIFNYKSDYLDDQKVDRAAGWAFGPVLAAAHNHRFLCAGLALFIGGMSTFYLKNHFDWVYGNFLLDHYLQTIMIHVATYVKALDALRSIINTNPELATFDEFKPLQELFEKRMQLSDKVAELIQLLNTGTFEGEASIFSLKGAVLRAFLLAAEINTEFQEAMATAGVVDAYASTATLVNEFASKNITFCFPTYQTGADTPSITLTNFWHPILSPDTVVSNSLTLGTNDQRPNVVLTGPNEGGKSTILKAVTLCLLFAQTLGIAPAQAMTFTPFHSIATYLNLTDDIGAGNSLFKAEVLRAQELIDHIEKAPKKEFYFAVFDEMFNGTTPVEASAASFSVAKHLAGFSNSICLFATHFAIMTTLEATSGRISNYHVSVEPHDDGSFGYPYKLAPGFSTQHVAIPILRRQGFAKTVLDDAQAVATQIAASVDTQGGQKVA